MHMGYLVNIVAEKTFFLPYLVILFQGTIIVWKREQKLQDNSTR